MNGHFNVTHHRALAVRQRGAILVVSLLLLLVMTVLALTASQTTRLQERMAGNARDLDLAFQAGEAGLRGAEKRIDESLAPKGAKDLNKCLQDDFDPEACDAVDRPGATLDYRVQKQEWWDENALALGASLYSVMQEPQYISEVRADITDTVSIGGSTPKSGTLYYVNTSRAVGATNTAVTVVETTYAVRY